MEPAPSVWADAPTVCARPNDEMRVLGCGRPLTPTGPVDNGVPPRGRRPSPRGRPRRPVASPPPRRTAGPARSPRTPTAPPTGNRPPRAPRWSRPGAPGRPRAPDLRQGVQRRQLGRGRGVEPLARPGTEAGEGDQPPVPAPASPSPPVASSTVGRSGAVRRVRQAAARSSASRPSRYGRGAARGRRPARTARARRRGRPRPREALHVSACRAFCARPPPAGLAFSGPHRRSRSRLPGPSEPL